MRRTNIKKLIAAAALAIAAGGVSAASAATSSSPFRIVPGPQPGNARLQASSAISTTDVWAVGSFQGSSDQAPSRTLAEHWNGRAWTVVATPSPTFNLAHGSTLDAVSAVSSSDVWALGNAGSSFHGGPTAGFIEHWDGTRWTVVASPSPVCRALERQRVEHHLDRGVVRRDAPGSLGLLGQRCVDSR